MTPENTEADLLDYFAVPIPGGAVLDDDAERIAPGEGSSWTCYDGVASR